MAEACYQRINLTGFTCELAIKMHVERKSIQHKRDLYVIIATHTECKTF